MVEDLDFYCFNFVCVRWRILQFVLCWLLLSFSICHERIEASAMPMTFYSPMQYVCVPYNVLTSFTYSITTPIPLQPFSSTSFL